MVCRWKEGDGGGGCVSCSSLLLSYTAVSLSLSISPSAAITTYHSIPGCRPEKNVTKMRRNRGGPWEGGKRRGFEMRKIPASLQVPARHTATLQLLVSLGKSNDESSTRPTAHQREHLPGRPVPLPRVRGPSRPAPHPPCLQTRISCSQVGGDTHKLR